MDILIITYIFHNAVLLFVLLCLVYLCHIYPFLAATSSCISRSVNRQLFGSHSYLQYDYVKYPNRKNCNYLIKKQNVSQSVLIKFCGAVEILWFVKLVLKEEVPQINMTLLVCQWQWKSWGKTESSIMIINYIAISTKIITISLFCYIYIYIYP